MTAVARRVNFKIQTSPYIILMLLCFCSSNAATQIGIFLISGLKGYTPSKIIITETLQTLGGSEAEISQLEEYIETKLRKFISTLSVNVIPALMSKYILQEMIVGFNPELLIKFYCSVVFSEKDMVISNLKSKMNPDFNLIRNVDFIEVRRNFNLLKTGVLERVSFLKQFDQNSRLLRKGFLDESKNNLDSNSVLSESMHNKKEISIADQRIEKHSIEEQNLALIKQLREYEHIIK